MFDYEKLEGNESTRRYLGLPLDGGETGKTTSPHHMFIARAFGGNVDILYNHNYTSLFSLMRNARLRTLYQSLVFLVVMRWPNQERWKIQTVRVEG